MKALEAQTHTQHNLYVKLNSSVKSTMIHYVGRKIVYFMCKLKLYQRLGNLIIQLILIG